MGILKRAAHIFAAPAVGAYKGAVESGIAPSVRTVKGALQGDKGDIARVGLAATALIPIGGVAARIRSAASGGSSAAREARTIAPLAFRDSNANVIRRARNTVMSGIAAADRGAAKALHMPDEASVRADVRSTVDRAFSWLPKTSEAESVAARSAFESRRKSTTLKRVADAVNDETGALRIGPFPKHAAANVQAAHANVPEGQRLFTASKNVSEPNSEPILAFTRNAKPGRGYSGDLTTRAAMDVRSGRARLAGFYEKIKSEEGSFRASGLIADADKARSLRGTSQEVSPWLHQAGKMDRLNKAPKSATRSTRAQIANGSGNPFTRAFGRLGSERGSVTLGSLGIGHKQPTIEARRAAYLGQHEGASDVIGSPIKERSKFHSILMEGNKMVPIKRVHAKRVSKN